MGQIQVEKNVGGIEGLCVITPTVHGDARGYFMETYNQKGMEDAGFHINFVQDNQSMSTYVQSVAVYLKWPLICASTHRPMENGMA